MAGVVLRVLASFGGNLAIWFMPIWHWALIKPSVRPSCALLRECVVVVVLLCSVGRKQK